MVLDPSLSPHAIDPTWQITGIALRHDKPNRPPLISTLGDVRRYDQRANLVPTETMTLVRDGAASAELPGTTSPLLHPDDCTDFKALSAFEKAGWESIKDLGSKTSALPTEGVFHPIVSGHGSTSRAALEHWRSFIEITSGQGFGRELGRQF